MTKVNRIIKGDKFICIHPRVKGGHLGTVISITTNPTKNIGLQFDQPIGFHSCDGKGKDGYCIWVRPSDIMTEEEYKEDQKIRNAASAVATTELEELILRK